jgi:hypothetical protein
MPGVASLTGPSGARPTLRNAVVFGLLPQIAMILVPGIFAGIGAAADSFAIMALGNLAQLGIFVWWMLALLKALDEMRHAAQNPTFPRWPIIMPIYNLIYILTMVPKEVIRAKTLRGLQPTTRPLVLYFFFPAFALQSDLNDIASAT